MSAQSELCEAPPPAVSDLDAARVAALNKLYELRYQTAEVALTLSQTHDLQAALAAQLAHGEILASISIMELSHPELA